MPTKPLKSTKKLMLGQAKPVSELEHYTSMLIYGEGGSGKTAFASSFPKPLILLDMKEKGTETIRQVEGIDVLEINEWYEFEETFWELKKDRHYKTVVLDQITSLQGIGIEHIRAENEYEAGDMFNKRDWGRLSGMMQTWLLNYRNLWSEEKDICFLAHQRVFGGEDDAGEDQIEPSVGARLSPSVSSFMNGAVSVIGNTFIREKYDKEKNRTVQYCMRVGPHAYYRAKIRLPPGSVEIPDVIVNPTYEKIMRLSRGESISRKVRK